MARTELEQIMDAVPKTAESLLREALSGPYVVHDGWAGRVKRLLEGGK